MSFVVAETLATGHCRRALEMAIQQLPKKAGRHLILHSDRGSQYYSQGYLDVQGSGTESSDSQENSVVERAIGILKRGYLSQYTVRSLDEAAWHLERAVFLYNYNHPHLSGEMLSPNEPPAAGGPGPALEKLLQAASYRAARMKYF